VDVRESKSKVIKNSGPDSACVMRALEIIGKLF
jgi:hypothetical protein